MPRKKTAKKAKSMRGYKGMGSMMKGKGKRHGKKRASPMGGPGE